MKRAMAKEGEAIREKRSRLIKASAEKESAQMFVDASKTIGDNKTAMALRQLQTWQEIGTEQNSLMMLIPTEALSNQTALPIAVSAGIKTIKKTKKE